MVAWLEYLGVDASEVHEIGFEGARLPGGSRIRDATHVLVRTRDVRAGWQKFANPRPAEEFLLYDWTRFVLPWIVADVAVDFGFTDAGLADTVRRTGLRPGDYRRFGLE